MDVADEPNGRANQELKAAHQKPDRDKILRYWASA